MLARILSIIVLLASVTAGADAFARGSHGSQHHPSTWSRFAKRAPNGRIARSSAARNAFLRSKGIMNGKTPKGMIIDHIVPLAAGGKDVPSNMRLITLKQENAQHAAEMASAKNPKGYNPYAQHGGKAKAKGGKARAAQRHHHHKAKP
jgi:hypothetical protein